MSGALDRAQRQVGSGQLAPVVKTGQGAFRTT